jgi:hypothetical protein
VSPAPATSPSPLPAIDEVPAAAQSAASASSITHIAKFTTTIAESVETFTSTKQEAFKSGLAAKLGVHRGDITLYITPASINVEVVISTTTAALSQSVATTVEGMDKAQLSTALGVQVTSVTSVTQTQTGGPLPGGIIALIVVVAVLFLALVGGAAFMMMTKKGQQTSIKAKAADVEIASATTNDKV